jgi:predicted secreted Zn-dependent protease
VRNTSRQIARCWLLGLCCWFIARTAAAETDGGPVYSYYVATAAADRSLSSTLQAASPIHHNGRVFFGHTDWQVRWSIHWSQEPQGACRITQAQTRISGTILLPKLVAATPAQQDRFNSFLAALRVHELGHYGIGKSAAAEIERAIRSLPAMDTCAALEAAANELGSDTLDKYRVIERRYDADTDNGRTQGAWLE